MNIALIGGTGGMGKLCNSFLLKHDHSTHCFNRALTNFEDEISKADVVIISVPKKVFPEIIEKLQLCNLKGKGIISLSSYMSDEVALLESVETEYSFVHLLFGPDIKYFAGQNIIFTPTKHEGIQTIITQLEHAGAEVVEASCERHDELMAHIQALSQLSSIALAKTLSDSTFSLNELQQASTITFRHNVDSIKRIVKQDAELWSAIQFTNQYFPKILEQHVKNNEYFTKLVAEKNSEAFAQTFESIQDYFSDTAGDTSETQPTDTKREVLGKKFGVLGPAGTYSHEAATKYGISDECIQFYKTIPEVLNAMASKEITDAIVPFENAIHGTVLETIDGIFKHNLSIVDELVLDINHVLAVVSPEVKEKDITDIYSHSQALGQCAETIQMLFPNAVTHPQGSTAGGMEIISKAKNKTGAAIGPAFAAELQGLYVLRETIADAENNQTLFVVLSSTHQESAQLKSTLLALTVKEDRPGLLADITHVFKENNINLAKIESRPSKEKLGTYIFYIKADVPPNDAGLQSLLIDLGHMGVVAKQLSR